MIISELKWVRKSTSTRQPFLGVVEPRFTILGSFVCLKQRKLVLKVPFTPDRPSPQRPEPAESAGGNELAPEQSEAGQATRKEREARPGFERSGGAGGNNSGAGACDEPSRRLHAGASEPSDVSASGENAGGRRTRNLARLSAERNKANRSRSFSEGLGAEMS